MKTKFVISDLDGMGIKLLEGLIKSEAVESAMVAQEDTASGVSYETLMNNPYYLPETIETHILSEDDVPLPGADMLEEVRKDIMDFDADTFAKSVEVGEPLTGADIGQTRVMGAGAPAAPSDADTSMVGLPSEPSGPDVVLSPDDRGVGELSESHKAVLEDQAQGGPSDLDSEIAKILGKGPIIKSSPVATPSLIVHDDVRAIADREAQIRKAMPASSNRVGPMYVVETTGLDDLISKALSEGREFVSEPMLGAPQSPLLSSRTCANELCKSAVPAFLAVCPHCAQHADGQGPQNIMKSIRKPSEQEFYLPLGISTKTE